jgi:hypothetical protein
MHGFEAVSAIATLALTASPAKPTLLGRSGGIMAHPEPIQTRPPEPVHPAWWMLPITFCIYTVIFLSLLV